MNARTRLAAGIASAVAAAALAAPSVAGAVTSAAAPSAGLPRPVSAASFTTASGRVSTAPQVAGVVPARGAGPARRTVPPRAASLAGTSPAGTAVAAAGATCTEPNCDLPYNGGPVQHSPRVYLIFWGPTWKTSTTEKAAENYLISFYRGLGKAPGENWVLTAAQYWDKKGRPAFGTSMLAGSHVDTATPPKTVTQNALANEADKALTFFRITNTDSAQIVIAAQTRTCFASITGVGAFAGNCGTPQTTGYCGFHDVNINASNASQFLPWVNLPYQPDAGQSCGAGFVNNPGTFDGFSLIGGHETMETVTDPDPTAGETAWYDARDGVSGGEIADKCAWDGLLWGGNDPGGDLTLSTGTFAMQSLWSNAARGCVMSGTLPLTATPVPDQRGVLGHHVRLAVKAALGGHAALTYRAAGLPSGLKISASTGVITGTLGVTAGTFHSRVIVSYYAGWHTDRFTWQVSSPAGPVKGRAGKCADAYRARTANGTKVDAWSCDGRNQQKITFTASGELQLLGKCVTGGKTAFLEPCKATSNQLWHRLASGEYVLKATGKCLTGPSSGTANGRQLAMAACRNTAGQHWSLT